MATRTDLDVAREHIFTLAGTVFQDFVPEGVAGVTVSARHQSGQVVGRVMSGAYAWTDQSWLVEVSSVTEDYTDLNTAAAALQTALDASTGTYTNGRVVACVLQSPFQQADVQPGESVKRMGGTFLIAAKGS